jgi:hypothetical protein
MMCAGGGAGTPHGPAQHSGPHSQGLLGAAEVDLLLAALDRDGDGRVSLEEMVQVRLFAMSGLGTALWAAFCNAKILG